MCRAKIDSSVCYASLDQPEDLDMKRAMVDDFAVRRDDYIATMRRRCARNAGFVGGSKLARSVARTMGDALEEAEMQTAGGQRVMVGKRATVERQAHDDDTTTFVVSYKPKGKRKPVVETYKNYRNAEELATDVADADAWSVLDLATYEPRFYWLVHHHYQGDVEDGMRQLGILAESKRRRRRR